MAYVPKNYVDNVGPDVVSAWLNPVDQMVFNVLGAWQGPPTVASVQTALGIVPGITAVPVPVTEGGTGQTTAGAALAALGGTTAAAALAAAEAACLIPATAAETATGLALNTAYPPGNMLRYGLVANSVGAGANNLAILKSLFNGNAQPPTTTGPTGEFYFPNITGADFYTFGVAAGAAPTVACRPGIRIRGNNVTLSVTGTASANDVNVGFLYSMSDFVIEDATILSSVDTTSGVNAAACLYFGARGAGFYFGTVTENTWAPSFGRIVVRNVILATTNTGGHSAPPIVFIGGHSDVLVQNYTINVNSIAGLCGIYYEWGIYSNPGGTVPGTTVTTHAKNMLFQNGRVINAATWALDFRGCYNCTIDGLYTNGCGGAFDSNPGQAMFYNVGPNDAAGAKRSMTLKNVVEQSSTLAVASIQLSGSNPAIGGIPANAWQKTDLMYFDVQGFSAANMVVSGNITARNGILNGAGAVLNPLSIQDDQRIGEFVDVQIIGGTGSGIRADVAGSGAWATPRQKFLTFRQCLIAGNVTAGAELNNVQNARFIDCQFGYNALNDPANEATQLLGILVISGCNGVQADSCIVTNSGGGAAYSITGTSSSGCNVRNPILIANGTVTTAGNWDVDGVAQANAGSASTGGNTPGFANKNTYPNFGYKYTGKLGWNTSNGVLYAAGGSSPTSAWTPVYGVTTFPVITPA